MPEQILFAPTSYVDLELVGPDDPRVDLDVFRAHLADVTQYQREYALEPADNSEGTSGVAEHAGSSRRRRAEISDSDGAQTLFLEAPPERLIAPPEIYKQSWVKPAPRLEHVINDGPGMQSRSAVPYFSWRNDHAAGFTGGSKKGKSFIEDYSEADVLFDLWHKLLGAQNILEQFVDHHRQAGAEPLANQSTVQSMADIASKAERARKELRFIGESEMVEAADGLARYWIDKLLTQQKIFVHADQSGSATYIFTRIMREFQKYDPTGSLQKRVHQFQKMSELTEADKYQMRRDGLVFVDDWAISGSQMYGYPEKYIHDIGIPEELVEINYICSPEHFVENGLGKAQVVAYFAWPYTVSHGEGGNPSLFGAHCSPDYGFTELLHCLNERVRIAGKLMGCPSYERYPAPVAMGTVSPYRGNVLGSTMRLYRDPKSAAVLSEHFARFTSVKSLWRGHHD